MKVSVVPNIIKIGVAQVCRLGNTTKQLLHVLNVIPKTYLIYLFHYTKSLVAWKV